MLPSGTDPTLNSSSDLGPKHVAIIMDGNGRWASLKNHARFFGHIRGASRISPIVRKSDELKIKALTLFAFSSENWKRPETEREVLWKLLLKFLKRQLPELKQNNVSLHVYGDISLLPSQVKEPLLEAVEELRSNTGLKLGFCVSYGSRDEILRGFKRYLLSLPAQTKVSDFVHEPIDLNQFLDTKDLGALSDVDLVLRTSGEQRVSNFLLWQSAYAEYVFLDKFWPDFTPQDLEDALKIYQSRTRRFGSVGK